MSSIHSFIRWWYIHSFGRDSYSIHYWNIRYSFIDRYSFIQLFSHRHCLTIPDWLSYFRYSISNQHSIGMSAILTSYWWNIQYQLINLSYSVNIIQSFNVIFNDINVTLQCETKWNDNRILFRSYCRDFNSSVFWLTSAKSFIHLFDIQSHSFIHSSFYSFIDANTIPFRYSRYKYSWWYKPILHYAIQYYGQWRKAIILQ